MEGEGMSTAQPMGMNQNTNQGMNGNSNQGMNNNMNQGMNNSPPTYGQQNQMGTAPQYYQPQGNQRQPVSNLGAGVGNPNHPNNHPCVKGSDQSALTMNLLRNSPFAVLRHDRRKSRLL